MVGHTDGKVEWQDGASIEARPDHRVGHLNPGLGSLSPRHQHRGTLVPPGEGMVHQLPGNLRKEQEGNISATKDRQYNGSCLHQPPRGNGIQRASSPDPGSMDVVPGEEHSHSSTASARYTEPGGRHGIQVHERLIRLEIGSSDFSGSQQTLWPTGSGPVRIQTYQPVPSLLQLVARSICRSNQCIPPGLEDNERFCQPTMELGAQGTEESTESGSRHNPNSPHMEDAAMVPSPVGNVSRLATPATQAGTQY